MWEKLFLLQEVEIKIQIDLKEKNEIDEKIYLEDGKKAKESLLSEMKNAITKYQLQTNKIESKIKEFEENKSEIQKKIYGGVVSNIKELQALKNEDEKDTVELVTCWTCHMPNHNKASSYNIIYIILYL